MKLRIEDNLSDEGEKNNVFAMDFEQGKFNTSNGIVRYRNLDLHNKIRYSQL